jgi:hypothetical protein
VAVLWVEPPIGIEPMTYALREAVPASFRDNGGSLNALVVLTARDVQAHRQISTAVVSTALAGLATVPFLGSRRLLVSAVCLASPSTPNVFRVLAV